MLQTYIKSALCEEPLVSLIPVFATSYFHQQRYVKRHAAFHQFVDLLRHGVNVVFVHFKYQFIVYLIFTRGFSSSSQASTAIIARLIMSAAVPCIGALIAARSAPARRAALLDLMSGK